MRELVVLGTASQAPTRSRNHNGYVLRWDSEAFLFDPGEGTQRQMLLAGVRSGSLTRICLTHLHGDHCLGLPGVVQRRGLDGVTAAVPLHYPHAGRPQVEALLSSTAHVPVAAVEHCPVAGDGPVARGAGWTLSARFLDHRVPTAGYRLVEDDGVRMLPDRLAAAGVTGPDVGRLAREGTLRVGGRTVRVEDVSAPRPGQVVAVVMDTRWCQAALELASGADLLLCESTFLHEDAALAEEYGHLTARQAGMLAREAGARLLVLTHYSQRYGDDVTPFAAEAAVHAPHVVAAQDLQVVRVPRRRALR